jgi:hypothetical protein
LEIDCTIYGIIIFNMTQVFIWGLHIYFQIVAHVFELNINRKI